MTEFKSFINGPIKLESNRVYRPFIGGKSIDVWEGITPAKDDNYGERWVASIVHARNPGGDEEEGLSQVTGQKGMTLYDLIKAHPEAMLGQKHLETYGLSMAILVKVIDAYSRLLIQVHPNRAKAKALFESPYGKTEAWYIIATRQIDGVKPYILMGFKAGVTRAWYEEKFHEQDIEALESCMHRIEVEEGDVYIIPGGLTHALGSGCMLVEIQEPTDYTIRSETKSSSGKDLDEQLIHQGLGFDKMFDCFDFTTYTEEALKERYKLAPKVETDDEANRIALLIEEDFFSMKHLTITREMTYQREGSFEILLVLKGSGIIRYEGKDHPLKQGDEFFLPNTVASVGILSEENQCLEMICCLPPKTQ